MAELETEDDTGYERPLLVRIIGILSILAGILFILIGILSAGIWATLGESSMTGMFPDTMLEALQILSYLIIGAGVGTALQGWGLLKMKPWAWIMVTFSLLATIFFAVQGYTSAPAGTGMGLSTVIAVIFIAGLLLTYFLKKKEYFDLEMLSTKTTLMIIGGLVTYTMISMVVTEMASTTIMQSFYEVVTNEGLLSV